MPMACTDSDVRNFTCTCASDWRWRMANACAGSSALRLPTYATAACNSANPMAAHPSTGCNRNNTMM